MSDMQYLWHVVVDLSDAVSAVFTHHAEALTLSNRLNGMPDVTQMSPGGMVRVENERLHAFSEGILIMQGETVEVVAVRGPRLVVKRAPAGATAALTPPPVATDGPSLSTAAPSQTLLNTTASEPEHLDFDVPQD